MSLRHCLTKSLLNPDGRGREFFIDNLLVRIDLIIKIISVDRLCAVGV